MLMFMLFCGYDSIIVLCVFFYFDFVKTAGLLEQLPDFPWTGTVVLVKGGQVYVNRGTREGVAVGQTFTVGEVEVLRDPGTGEVLDSSMNEIARLTVSQVKEKLSIADVTSGNASAIVNGMTIFQP